MVSKGEALTHFIGQLILGILQIVAVIGYLLLFSDYLTLIFGVNPYSDMILYSTVGFFLVHGFWRILDNFVRWRNAD